MGTTNELKERIRLFKEYSAMIEELDALKSAIADEFKALMIEINQERLEIGEYRVNYVDCLRTDIDKKKLEREQSEIYNSYLKTISYKRFTIV
jgi:predicted phage-related endonuclease